MRPWLTVAAMGGIGLLAAPVLIAGAASEPSVGDPVVSSEPPVYAVAPQAHASSAPSSRTGASRDGGRSSAPTTATVAGRADVDPSWAASSAARAGIPEVAVRAYGRAELMLRTSDPGCDLGWTTLAGIGYVESRHGTIDGRGLLADGHSTEPILGPALDGSGDFAAIPASALSAQWHGDAHWDHAVGPLQFIPSTWARWSSDGDGDGVGDPNDLDDAAFAAARYLCADGRNLGTGDGWGAAIFSYNHSREYIDAVYAAASDYAARTR